MCQAFDELMEDMRMKGKEEGKREWILKISKCSEEEFAIAAGR